MTANNQQEGLMVIGAGWGRTGTDSLRQAINMLGLGPTMHMYELMEDDPFAQVWHWLKIGAAKSTEQRDRLLKEAMAKYRSACDGPAFVYYADLMRLYPQAKIVLTVRNSAKEWYDSATQTIFLHTARPWSEMTMDSMGLHLYQKLHPFGWLFQEMLKSTMGDITPFPMNRTDTEMRYDNWIMRVKQEVPQDKLLIFNAQDGWEPLCDFLNVPVPEVPYPKLNSKAHFRQVLEYESRMGWMCLLVYMLLAFLILRGCGLVFKRKAFFKK